MKTRNERRFTLIEMLVVISIISILAAMLSPALVKARNRAMAIGCLNNLKQMGGSAMLYATDFTVYPNEKWDSQMASYAGYDFNASVGPKILRCPGAVETTNKGGALDVTYSLAGAYGNWLVTDFKVMIGFGIWQNNYHVKESAIRRHGEKSVFVEYWDDDQNSVKLGKSQLNDRNVMMIHDKRGTVVLADGHAEVSTWSFASKFGTNWPTYRFNTAECKGEPAVFTFLPTVNKSCR